MADTPDLLNQFAKALGLGDDATPDTILATLTTRLGDADKITTERDAAVAEVAKIKGEANTARVEAEIKAAVTKAGIFAHSTDDAATILRGVLEVTDKGVVTKAAPNVVPGQTAEQFIVGQLRTLRPHYWPTSVGAGAKGAGYAAHAGPDVSCFEPGGRLTDQMSVVGRAGEQATIEACRRAGIMPPAWLTGGGR
jgi:hypothetical protein